VVDCATNSQNFQQGWESMVYTSSWNTASFAVANPATFPFIRLALTDKTQNHEDRLYLQAVEFFGALSE
jgi:hypothetical protein